MYSVGWRDTKRLPVNLFFSMFFIMIFVEIAINHFRLARTWTRRTRQQKQASKTQTNRQQQTTRVREEKKS